MYGYEHEQAKIMKKRWNNTGGGHSVPRAAVIYTCELWDSAPVFAHQQFILKWSIIIRQNGYCCVEFISFIAGVFKNIAVR